MCASDDLVVVDLEEIELRCRAAAPGPWESYVVGRDFEAGLNCIATGDARSLEIVGGTIADQDFIAYAREGIPMLIAEVRRLRAALNNAVQGENAPATTSLGRTSLIRESVVATQNIALV